MAGLSTITSLPGRVRTAVSRATAVPLMIRFGVLVSGLLAMGVSWPAELLAGRLLIPLALVAIWPAVAPRGRGGSFAAIVAVVGWLLDTTAFDAHIALWRVLALAALLYLAHTLTALAAVLPYDAMVNLDVPALWLGRAAVVVLIAAVLIVLALGLTADLGGSAFQLATLLGLVTATAVTMVLACMARRG
ncbi:MULTISPECIES: hypothetical protein [Actinoplanes]|uniref:hypothetical protein n=1 Tax=Actinoplanes TaxID=1865 RepID=UPI0005F283FF|nr:MULTISPECIES: hypothetical protein [Actinoplanes]GLY01092.1 hypothetical protein Acsp01_14710 [Actinoplanes sp. NBRC 101535]